MTEFDDEQILFMEKNEFGLNYSDYKILVVDDVLSNVLLLKALLSSKNFQIMTANNGNGCLEAVRNEQPDLILLDVMMPDMSGFEVAKILKSDPDYNDIPIIFLTALNSSADIVRGFQAGANDFVLKPFNKDELIIRVMHQISLVAAKRIITGKNHQLEAAIHNRDRMYSVIAHDLRSPMGMVKMMLDMLLQMVPKETVGEEIYMLISQCSTQTEDTFSLLDNLLKWTKSQTGRLNVVRQKFHASELLASIADVYKNTAGLKQISLTYRPDPSDSIDLFADIDMCKTVVRNFISNAIKFTPEGGSITLSTSRYSDTMVKVDVKDTGCGLSEDEKNKLFNVKTHFTKYGTNAEEGSGLGLLLCMDFAIKNGGELFVESEEGKGSTFSFTLPVFVEGMGQDTVIPDKV